MLSLSNMKLVLVLSVVAVYFVSDAAGASGGNATDISAESIEAPRKDRGRSFGNGTSRGRGRNFDSKTKRYFRRHCGSRYYQIEEIKDLRKHKSNLRCIFRNGFAPSKVPEGTWHGHVLTIMATDNFNPFVSFMWNGKLAMKAQCNGKDTFIGWNNIAGMPTFPFMARIGPLDETLAKDTYEDDKDSVIMDYTKDFSRACPEYKSYSKKGNVMHNAFQFNQMINVMRIVGQKRDGSAIYLGKSYIREGHSGDKKVHNIGYFAVTNFDPEIAPPKTFDAVTYSASIEGSSEEAERRRRRKKY